MTQSDSSVRSGPKEQAACPPRSLFQNRVFKPNFPSWFTGLAIPPFHSVNYFTLSRQTFFPKTLFPDRPNSARVPSSRWRSASSPRQRNTVPSESAQRVQQSWHNIEKSSDLLFLLYIRGSPSKTSIAFVLHSFIFVRLTCGMKDQRRGGRVRFPLPMFSPTFYLHSLFPHSVDSFSSPCSSLGCRVALAACTGPPTRMGGGDARESRPLTTRQAGVTAACGVVMETAIADVRDDIISASYGPPTTISEPRKVANPHHHVRLRQQQVFFCLIMPLLISFS